MIIRTNRLGEKNISLSGQKMEICRYGSSIDIDVLFESGYIAKNRHYDEFAKGAIKDKEKACVYGVGYIGEGEYNSKINNKHNLSYASWRSMLGRCYSHRVQLKSPTYIGCLVDEKWHDYQNFAKWYNENVWAEETRLVVDKDIINKNNKTYSEENCILVDHRINSLFSRIKPTRDGMGVGIYNHGNKFKVQICSLEGDSNRLKYYGLHNTFEEAVNCYTTNKEKIIKQVADEYKSKYPNFPQKLYDAMYSYEVEITD